MPALKNQRHEKFCQLVGRGVVPPLAYTEAGYTDKSGSRDANASRLLKNAKISGRLAELAHTHPGNDVLSLSEAKEILTGISRGDIQESAAERISAIKTLATMTVNWLVRMAGPTSSRTTGAAPCCATRGASSPGHSSRRLSMPSTSGRRRQSSSSSLVGSASPQLSTY